MNERTLKVCVVASADISLKFLLFSQMKHLQEAGFEVWAVSSPGRWVGEIEQAGIPVCTVEITRRLFTPIADIAALVRLLRFFKKESFDIVHTHTPKATFLGQLAAFLANVPVRVATIHGLYFQKKSSWRKKAVFLFIERIVGKIVHLAFSVNREDMQFLVEKGIYAPRKVRYIGGGVNLEKFNPLRFSPEFISQKKQEIGIPKEALIVGIVARLVKEKGFLPLFSAFQSLLEKVPKACLLVVGPHDPEKEDALDLSIVKEYGIEKNIVFVGERTDVIELYALMDVFVLPSFREGLGLSLIEASAMQLPVVASEIRGCREAVDNGKTGILVPPNDAGRLAKALHFILTHREESRAMGQAGRQKAAAEFNEKEMFASIEREYRRLLRENRAEAKRRR